MGILNILEYYQRAGFTKHENQHLRLSMSDLFHILTSLRNQWKILTVVILNNYNNIRNMQCVITAHVVPALVVCIYLFPTITIVSRSFDKAVNRFSWNLIEESFVKNFQAFDFLFRSKSFNDNPTWRFISPVCYIWIYSGEDTYRQLQTHEEKPSYYYWYDMWKIHTVSIMLDCNTNACIQWKYRLFEAPNLLYFDAEDIRW
jgi:hypothetical protein